TAPLTSFFPELRTFHKTSYGESSITGPLLSEPQLELLAADNGAFEGTDATGRRGSGRLQGRRARPGAFPLRYKTASPSNGGVKVLFPPPLTSAPGVLSPVVGFIHSTRMRPSSFERSTVKVPPDGA